MKGNYKPTAANSGIEKQNHLAGLSQTNHLPACEDGSSFCTFLYLRHFDADGNKKINYTPAITISDEMPKNPSNKVRLQRYHKILDYI